MELGACFDDEFFEKSPEKKENAPLKYEAKSCSPKWFMDPRCIEEGNADRLNNLRYQADFNYHSKNFKEASLLYERCLKAIPLNNTAARRECYENLARSALHEDQAMKALEWALRMHAICCNADQSLVSLNLLAIVCHRLGKYPEEMESLRHCLETHGNFPEMWLRIAYCHAGLLGIWLPYSGITIPVLTDTRPQCCAFKERTLIASSIQVDGVKELANCDLRDSDPQAGTGDLRDSSKSETDAASRNNPCSSKCESCEVVTQLIIGCLIRARLLITALCPNQSPIAIEKRAALEKKIEASFKVMGVDPVFLEEATKLLHTTFLETMGENEVSSLEETESSKKEDKTSTQDDTDADCGVQSLGHGS